MNLLNSFVKLPFAEAAGWALLHSLWEGIIIAAALTAVLMALRSPRARYAAACVAMLMMAAALGLTLIRMIPQGEESMRGVRTPALPRWNVSSETDSSGPLNPGLATVVPWLAPFWMAGVCLFYLGHSVSWVSACRLRRRGVCCASECWRDRIRSLSARLHLSRQVELLESCLVDAPMVLGHFRPVILMPIGLLTGLPAEQIEAILLHELAHVQRHDYLINVFQRFVEGLMFYHPAVWWISRVIRTERENCCDDVAVAMSGDVHQYAAALAVLEGNRQSSREPALAATGGNLVKRINRLLYPKGPNGAWTPLFAAIIFLTTGTVGLTAWQAKANPQKPTAVVQEDSTLGVVMEDHSPYDKWMTEDVVYIIGDEEHAAFKKLTTDDERQKFIEQFWERRDPTPGTGKNAFREEHYRRIVYANDRFRTSSGRPGWQTDRGHMYIVYGPPDAIESHPSGEPGFYPHETWLYYHVDGIGDKLYFTFVDRARTGDYHLAPANGH